MDDYPIDVSDPKMAQRYARLYFWLIVGACAVIGAAVARERDFRWPYALFIVVAFLLPFYYRWRKLARVLSDSSKAELISFVLAQKARDYESACADLGERLGWAEESRVMMADPRTWRSKQRRATFSGSDIKVTVFERNGLVGDLKAYLR